MFAADDTCVQPHYFAHVAAFISQQTGIADVNFSAQSPSTSDPHSTTAAPSTDSHPTSASVVAGLDETTPLSTAPGSPTTPSASSSSAASEGGSSSFEFIEASTEGLPLPAKKQEEGEEEESAIVGAGSLGPKGEVEEVLREAKDELRRQKL